MTASESAVTRGSLLPASSLDISLDVETPEQIALSYSIAGIGSRGAAAAIDTLISFAILAALTVILLIAANHMGPRPAKAPPSSAWVLAFYFIAQFVVMWGYYVIFEGIWDGQTPGKRIMKLRVVRDGGFSVTFGASAVRNLLRVVDAFGVYLVAIVVALMNSSRKRLGDIVAGTFVVKEERADARSSPVKPAAVQDRNLFTRLSDDEYSVLERYVERRSTLDPAHRDAIVTQLATRFAEHLPAATAPIVMHEPAVLRREATLALGTSNMRLSLWVSSAGMTSQLRWMPRTRRDCRGWRRKTYRRLWRGTGR